MSRRPRSEGALPSLAAGPSRALSVALLLSFSLAAASRADAQHVLDVRIGGGGIQVIERRGADELVIGALVFPGTIYDLARRGTQLYLARGRHGLTEVDLRRPDAPRVITTLPADAPVVKLFISGDRLLVFHIDAPSDTYDLREPLLAAPPEGKPVARVVAVRKGYLTLKSEDPTGEPIHEKDRFAIRSAATVHVTDPASGQLTADPSRELLGIVEVAHLVGGQGVARVPRGMVVAAGDYAFFAVGKPRDELLAPPLWAGTSRVRAVLRPALTVDHSGFVGQMELSVDHYFRAAPIRLGVSLAPASLIVATNPADLSGRSFSIGDSGLLLGSAAFATSYFEIGFGVGANLHSRLPSGVAAAATLRGGSIDGFHLTLTAALTVAGRDVFFGGLTGELDFPLTRDLMLDVAAGGEPGWGYATAGLKAYLYGWGGPGTVVLLFGVGAAGVTEVNGFNFGVSGVGPALTAGLDLRL